MKKLATLLLSLIIMASAMTGCGGTASSPSNASSTPAANQSAAESTGNSDDKYYLAIAIHSLDNEFWAQEAKGAELFASKIPNLETNVLTCDGDDNKQLQGIKDFIAKYGKKACVVADPSSAANTANIAEVCEEAGVYFTLLNHRAEGLFPEDFEYFTAHLTPNDFSAGYKTAKYMFDQIGGKGKVCELYGMLGEDSAAARHEGFVKALSEYPDIELVEMQVASWSQEEALKITETWLAMHEDIDAIFSANDGMALGAVEALKKAGKNGDIKICGTDGISAAFEAIEAGDMICTIANDGYMLMGYGAAFSYYAANGTYKPADLTEEERMIYTKTAFVTAENIKEMKATYITGAPDYDYSYLSFASDGPQDRANLK